MNSCRILVGAFALVCLLAVTIAADVPRLVNYQGRLTDSEGSPVTDGNYTVTFSIWSVYPPPMGTDPLWSSGAQTVSVVNGLFTYQLGSSVPLPDTVFTEVGGEERVLTINLATGGPTPVATEDILTVPFSYQALHADTCDYAFAGAGGGGGYWQLGEGGAIYYNAGNVGIGVDRPAYKLDVDGNIHASTMYSLSGFTVLKNVGSETLCLGKHAGEGSGDFEASTFLGNYAAGLGSGMENTFVGYAAGYEATGEANTYVGMNAGHYATEGQDNTAVGKGAGGHAIGMRSTYLGTGAGANEQGNSNTYVGASAGGSSTGGHFNTLIGYTAGRNIVGQQNTILGAYAGYNATGSNCVFLGDSAGFDETNSDRLVIHNANEGIPLLYGNFSNNRLGINTTALNYTLNVLGGVYSFGSGAGYRFECPGLLQSTFRIYGSDGYARLWNSFGGEIWRIGTTGNTNIGGTTSENHRLYIESSGWRVPGATGFFSNRSDSGIALLADNNSDDATAVFVNYGDGDTFRCFNGNGGAWQMTFAVTNWGRAICNELELLGGSDLAEPFAMSEGEVPAGALVVIDSENPGKLKLSSRAYDTRVAGIVSGAGGVKPGLTLSQKEVFEDGQNVAINGRVYCLADASYGAIRPGDMLTTSATPGHAMKATDRNRAYGSVIGKAMSGLDNDTGLVLVLVNLQ